MSVINREIKSKKIRLVTEDGLEEKSFEEAIMEAEYEGFDLLEVSVQGDISICKIIDYSKLLYEQKKREKKQPKKEVLKEVKIGSLIAEHDLGIKANTIDRLVKQGNKVKITIGIKGNRGRDNKKIALELYNNILEMLGDNITVISEVKVEGKTGTFTVKGK